MNVQIQTVHFDADSKLLAHINAKMEKLNTFHDKIIGVEVYLKLNNRSHHVCDKVTEIKVLAPKHSYFVKHESMSFEESFGLAFESLLNQVRKYKQKQLVYN